MMKSAPTVPSQALLEQIGDAIAGVKFGHVQVIIHNAQVVQIEKVEKVRVDSSANPSLGGIQQPLSRDDRKSGSPRFIQGR